MLMFSCEELLLHNKFSKLKVSMKGKHFSITYFRWVQMKHLGWVVQILQTIWGRSIFGPPSKYLDQKELFFFFCDWHELITWPMGKSHDRHSFHQTILVLLIEYGR